MSSADVPGDVAEMKRMAGQMEEDNPRWIVLFGEYSRQFVAFPRFKVRSGTVVAACYAKALPPRMRAVEERELPRPAASPPRPEGRGDAYGK